MKLALVIVDMQNLFLQDHKDSWKVGEACEYINHVAGLFRSKGHPVIHVQDMEGASEDLSPEAREIIPEINTDPGDLRVTKEFTNAFWKTDLEQLLHEHQAELVIVAGFAAEHCVTFTWNGAVERGFNAVILQKGICSSQPEAVSAAYRDRQIVSYNVIECMI
ncbi:cysteine hydrolase family protein ['Paenibacillus yunnanensis' Narsing Rao et al. 2020]|uniref:cysteine hydrolase family protein n=1 Tax=Paenibacillus tengchongensis TaxID=2608684 RepID=UPI00124D532E|nr:isochorismatase family cysteine hydrolase [Paenibacillus tengchongensis]